MSVKSKKWSLDLVDLGKGLLVSALSAGVGSLVELLNDGNLNMSTLRAAGFAALVGGLGYLAKNLTTNSDGEVLGKERRKSR